MNRQPTALAAGRRYELTFDVSRRAWWSSNDRPHWRAQRRMTRELRELAAWTARAQRAPRFERAHVIAHVSYPTNTTADPANVVGTVVKALVDGLVQDAHLLPDDDDTHLVGPDPRRAPKTGAPGLWRVRLEVLELPHHPTEGTNP